MSAQSLSQALKTWETKNDAKSVDASELMLYAQLPPINKLDNSLNTLSNCEKLSLSTNMIDRMASFAGMSKLRILSLGRNNIKKVEKLEDVASSLEQLWISYNQISSLDGLGCLSNLTTLYCARNLLKSFDELDKLVSLTSLREVLFVGNPFGEGIPKSDYRVEIIRKIPQITKIDGEMVNTAERESANEQKNPEE